MFYGELLEQHHSNRRCSGAVRRGKRHRVRISIAAMLTCLIEPCADGSERVVRCRVHCYRDRVRRSASSRERTGVELEMLADEATDEEVAMIVAVARAQHEALTGLRACSLEFVGPQLIEKRIGPALVDQ